jgi:hypothetical protein
MKPQRGFIALMSALIISAVLLLMATSGSFAGYYSRTNSLNSEFKARSAALADACANQTLLALANDSTYTGNATTTVSGSDVCWTGPITKSGGHFSFKTRGYVGKAYTALYVVANTADLSIVSWSEQSGF